MFTEYKWLSPKMKRTGAIVNPMLKMLRGKGSNLKVLDAGCGDGMVSELIVKLGNEVWGLDKNPEALAKAKEKGVKTIETDLEKPLPLGNDSFDVVWCLRSLEHIFNTEYFLKECYRVLKPEGILLITAQNMVSFTNRVRVFLGWYPLWVAPSENYPWHDHPRFTDHVRCFTKPLLKEVIERAGFKVEKITSDFVCFNVGEYNFPPWSESLGKIFPNLGETLIVKAKK